MLEPKRDNLDPLTPEELERLQQRPLEQPLSPRQWEQMMRTMKQQERYTLT